MKHLSDQTLSAHLDRALTGRAAEEAERHLASCEVCRESLAEMMSQDQALRPALTRDPGDAYFESFASRVESRIRSGAASRERAGFDLGAFFRSPRALAWAGGAAALIGGAAIVLMTQREVTPVDLRDREVAARARQEAVRERNDATTRDQAPPAPALTPAPSPPAASEPTAPVEEEIVVGRDKDAKVLAQDELAKTPAAPSAPQSAAPSRAREVRTTEGGEQALVRREKGLAPPPPSQRAGATTETGQVRKPSSVAPLGAARSQSTGQLDAQAQKKDTAAGEYLYIAPPPTSNTARRLNEREAARFSEPEIRLCGEVLDPYGRPVVGAQVAATDLGRSATTNARGEFCIAAPPGDHPLSVMAIGFEQKSLIARVQQGQGPLKVALEVVPVLGGKRVVTPMQALDQKDRYSVLPDTLLAVVRAAQGLQSSAQAQRSASLYDAAAAGWERSLRRIAGGPLELETRWHLAESRFFAWQAGPTDRRATAAIDALSAYTLRAPAGRERDQATRWLNQVRR